MRISLSFGIAVIGWFLLTMIGTGVFIVRVIKTQLKLDKEGVIEITDIERLTSEAFLYMYEGNNAIGRLNFLLMYGARFWAILLFPKNGR